MTNRYLITHVPHFIGGVMVYPDRGEASIVTLPPTIKPGRWLKPVGDARKPSSSAVLDPGALYAAKHVGGGHYHVELIASGDRASVLFKRDDGDAKEKAEAEAARLNAGGDLQLEAEDEPPAKEELPGGQDDDLPDA